MYKSTELIKSEHLILGGPAADQAREVWQQVEAIAADSGATTVFVMFGNRTEEWVMQCLISPDHELTIEGRLKVIMSLLLRGLEPKIAAACTADDWSDVTFWTIGADDSDDELDKAQEAFWSSVEMLSEELRRMN